MARISGSLDQHHGAGVPKVKSWPYQRNPDRNLTNVHPANIRSYDHLMRQERRTAKGRLRYFGIKAARVQWMTSVRTTAIEVPEWAQQAAHKEMSQGKHYAWFKGRRLKHAKRLFAEDRAAGGDPEMTLIQWRRCKACGRILLALEAEDRRKLDESCWLGRQKPCGAECGNT
jgi:hypothetical protein